MTGRGKGGKGLGKGGAKHHRKVLCDNILGITKPAIAVEVSSISPVSSMRKLVASWRSSLRTSSVMPSPTPNTPSARPLSPWTLFMLWRDRAALSPRHSRQPRLLLRGLQRQALRGRSAFKVLAFSGLYLIYFSRFSVHLRGWHGFWPSPWPIVDLHHTVNRYILREYQTLDLTIKTL